MSGLFITLEGVDGCGKSTQSRLLEEYIQNEKNMETVLTREPGGCKIGEKIRDILLDTTNGDMDSRTEALLYAAARAQHVAEVIQPALTQDKVVISDRFIDSSLAYQGVGRDLGIDTILSINQFAMQNVFPHKTFFLDLPPDQAFKRMSKRTTYDRLELQHETFHKKLYDGFVMLAQRWPERIMRIDASGSKQQTQQLLRQQIDKLLETE